MLFLQDAAISYISHLPLSAIEGCLPSVVEWPLKIQFASPFTACADNPSIEPLLHIIALGRYLQLRFH